MRSITALLLVLLLWLLLIVRCRLWIALLYGLIESVLRRSLLHLRMLAVLLLLWLLYLLLHLWLYVSDIVGFRPQIPFALMFSRFKVEANLNGCTLLQLRLVYPVLSEDFKHLFVFVLSVVAT